MTLSPCCFMLLHISRNNFHNSALDAIIALLLCLNASWKIMSTAKHNQKAGLKNLLSRTVYFEEWPFISLFFPEMSDFEGKLLSWMFC